MFYYGFGYFSYFPLYLLAILVVAIASSSVRSAYQKYSRVRNERMMTGEQAARRILQIRASGRCGYSIRQRRRFK